ncbi:hypothetical protein EIN_252840 [Entamoeba invadens IP1]|uniref:Uncharacterized protein n=1 Tax=Entamoeba invadens IP1 TaxID=370355 RepID=A0A0A1UEQ3_ENTIV|nr:hypothetical protein EIN_252840 [Entamoeba invadens IP1]ELP95040.1 hypothetical protein EIN_252840 [Entamoeba invadens IP1]|eukprot:XP_004261811.1 hypothetical protein EIN_252840 [Entamoeba invadens IP1]
MADSRSSTISYTEDSESESYVNFKKSLTSNAATPFDDKEVFETYAMEGWGNDSSETNIGLFFDLEDEPNLPDDISHDTKPTKVKKEEKVEKIEKSFKTPQLHSLSKTMKSDEEMKSSSIEEMNEVSRLMQRKQIENKKEQKLAKLTGRQNSLEKISPFLVSDNADQARQNGKNVIKSDLLKQKMGERISPDTIDKRLMTNKKKEQDKKKSRISKLFGRDESFIALSNFLIPQTRSFSTPTIIHRVEKLKKLAGV